MNPATIDIVTPPAVEPVSLVDMLAHLKIDLPDDAQNAVLMACVAAARAHVENGTGRALITQTLVQRLDAFPRDGEPIVLLRSPAQSITIVTYVDGNGTTITLAAGTDYAASLGRGLSRVGLPGSGCWPVARSQPGAVSITYVAGYGLAAAVPPDLVAAVKLLAATWYGSREDTVAGMVATRIPTGLEALINMNRTAIQF